MIKYLKLLMILIYENYFLNFFKQIFFFCQAFNNKLSDGKLVTGIEFKCFKNNWILLIVSLSKVIYAYVLTWLLFSHVSFYFIFES